MPVMADLLQVDKLRPREMNSLTEDNATSQLQIGKKIKMQKQESSKIMMCIGDARQQCCSSHHYSSIQNLGAFNVCHMCFQAQGSRRGGEYKSK